MNLRWTTWGVGLLGVLALPGCSGDDLPTIEGPYDASVTTGAGGAGNDASMTGTDTSTGKAGASASDSGDAKLCSRTAAMAITGQDIGLCRAAQVEGGADSGDAGAACFFCLCSTCPLEAKTCGGDPNCKAVNDCCRATCNCPGAVPEGGSDAPASDAPSSDAPSSSDAADNDSG